VKDRSNRSNLVLLAAILLTAASAPGANYGEKAKNTAAKEIFNNNTVLRLHIEIGKHDLEALRWDNRKEIRADVYEQTNTWRDVSLHIKGSAGSRRAIDDKPSLTLNFSKLTSDKRFHGLRKIHLNNSIQDQSYLCENICSELFRNAGVPSARVSFATVSINGIEKGLYVLNEGFTKDMIGMYFKNTKGNLYESGFLRDVDEPLEKHGGGGDVQDWSDLKALASAAQLLDEQTRWRELNRLLDVDRFMSFAALDVITWNWDGYVKNRNNYRVYHDPDTGKMTFLPHGLDRIFWYPRGKIMPEQWFRTIVAEGLIPTTTQGERLYLKRFGEVYTNVFRIEILTNRVNELAALLHPHAGRDYDMHVQRIRDLILARHAYLGRALHGPLPQRLVFTHGIATISNWQPDVTVTSTGIRCDRMEAEGRKLLRISVSTNAIAAWTTTVVLERGRFRFEALVKAKPGVAVPSTKEVFGARIRHEGTDDLQMSRQKSDPSWDRLSYDFYVRDEDEITLFCELSATEGEAWFDVDSLRLVKVQ
jgi:hypothetical protein